jgi:cytochrome P450
MGMALNPDKQRLAHEEMDRLIGGGRVPQLSDRHTLPYLEATIKETIRWHPALPLSMYHFIFRL